MWFVYNFYQTKSRCLLYLVFLNSNKHRLVLVYSCATSSWPILGVQACVAANTTPHLDNKGPCLDEVNRSDIKCWAGTKPACPVGSTIPTTSEWRNTSTVSPYITHYAYRNMDWTLMSCWEQVSTRRSTMLT